MSQSKCWAPKRKVSGSKIRCVKKLNFDDFELDCDNKIEVKVYSKKSKKQIKKKQVQKSYRAVYGPNQEHVVNTEVFPCGQQQMLFADDDPQNYHDVLYHEEDCTGVEHFTTCSNPADPYMEVWSRQCTKRCPVLQDSIQKVCTKSYYNV